MRKNLALMGLALLSPLTVACGGGLKPGDNDLETVQRALLEATPGSVILLGEGTFRFNMGLSLTVNNVTLRGQGMDKTILSFKDQSAGGQGLGVKADGFVVEDLAVEDTPGDGIKVEGGKGVTFRRVRAEWTRGPNTQNGAYGLYPVQCENVLIEDSVVRGASDAGFYVGQSRNIVVRRNRATQNVAGIEIENSTGADVYENTATGNTGGIAIFALPGLQVKSGGKVRVYNNTSVDNNTENFAPKGNAVGGIPSGTGMFIMANNQVEVFGNTIKDNQTGSLAIISYVISGGKNNDPAYDPYPQAIYIHDNTFEGGGDRPDVTRELGLALATFIQPLPVPDVIYDGILDPKKLVNGKLPDDLRICVKNNQKKGGTFSFANIDGPGLLMPVPAPKINRDAAPYDCTHPALPAITLPGGQG